jgi:LysM repeat protein
MKKTLNTLFFLFTSVGLFGQNYTKFDIVNYIQTYSEVAVEKMQMHKIPASITLAQGILESAAGKSELAINANNHFGIKCHKSWTGETYHKDDDQQNECFRKYDSPMESFEDHSQFLMTARYADLFTLEITDYKGWANGLKKAGYATDNQYPQKLIRLIEEYDLTQYDPKNPSISSAGGNKVKPSHKPKETNTIAARGEKFNGFSPVNYPYTLRTVYKNNGSYFIVAKAGDTFYDIAVDVQLNVSELKRYNDVPNRKYEPFAGEMVYLQRKKAYAEIDYHILKPKETLRSVAQQYGCRLSSIYKLNNLNKPEITVEDGMRLQLKK